MKRWFVFLFLPLFVVLSGCGVYSFTGATIEGKTINIHVMENRAMNVVPSLTSTLTDKIRSRILSQTGLAPVTTDNADYDISGAVTGYNVTVSGVQNTQQATQNRLTITIDVTFKNKLNEKANFNQSFSRFADFPATSSLQSVETSLINDIGAQLADDIFNKAFVNW
ncbi:LptE family protein [Taibaiella soli]|uniref:LptE family protein n=1 Tax=Taibaiella soli TaxID=1649169 RepID=A0A2W2BLJ9_9BACT|nr:LptE family protein [Taibaiella soli]PZF74306.1 hypothetical protein DN068_04675 [Taibaiella soli]